MSGQIARGNSQRGEADNLVDDLPRNAANEAAGTMEGFLPGRRLRKAREAKGLTSEDVAAQLNLSESYLTHLEHDDYDRLPGPTFVRGYLRSYARLLRLNDNEIIYAYEELLSNKSETDVPKEDQVTINVNHKPKDAWIPWVGMAVLAVVVALTANWWFAEDGASSLDQLEHVKVQKSDGGLVVEAFEPEIEVAPVAEVVEDADLNESAAVAEDGIMEDIPEEIINGEVSLISLKKEEITESQPESQNDVADNELTPMQIADSLLQQNGIVVGDQLQFQFAEQCWLEVTDINGKRIYSGLQQADGSLAIKGNGPFQVKLGNWRAVDSLTLNGETIEIPQSRRGDVIQFTVSE